MLTRSRPYPKGLLPPANTISILSRAVQISDTSRVRSSNWFAARSRIRTAILRGLITPPPQLRTTAIVRSKVTARKILAWARSPDIIPDRLDLRRRWRKRVPRGARPPSRQSVSSTTAAGRAAQVSATVGIAAVRAVNVMRPEHLDIVVVGRRVLREPPGPLSAVEAEVRSLRPSPRRREGRSRATLRA